MAEQTSQPRTLFEKIWEDHVVADQGDGIYLLHVDRHMVHEMTSSRAFANLARAGRKVKNPEMTFAAVDHIVATTPNRGDDTNPAGQPFIQMLRKSCADQGLECGTAADGCGQKIPSCGVCAAGQLCISGKCRQVS